MSDTKNESGKPQGIQTPFGMVGVADPTTLVQERILPRREPPKQEEKAPHAKPDEKPEETKEKRSAALGIRDTFLDMINPPRKPGEKRETDEEKAKREADEKKAKDDEEARKREDDERRRNSEMTPERIAEISAKAAGAVVEQLGIKPGEKDVEDPITEPDLDKLPERYQEDADLYTALAETNPDKYKDIVRRIAASDAAEQKYIGDWKKKNPGKEFDPDDDAHDEFYDKIEVKIPEKDLKAAREKSVDIRAARVTRETLEAERRKLQAKERSQTVEATSKQRAGVETLRILTEIDPKLDLLVQDEGKRNEVLKVIQSDRALNTTFEQLAPIASEQFRQVELLSAGAVQYDPANAHHAAIVNAATEAHKEISALPEENRIIEGRKYVSPDVFAKLPADKKTEVWTVGPAEISSVLRRKFAQTLRDGVKNTRRLAREIAGLPPEEDDSGGGGEGRATDRRPSTFARGGVLNAVGGRTTASRRGSPGSKNPEDAFFQAVGGS